MNFKNYVFDFVVPQGPTGPTGPSGVSAGLTAYGGRYSTASEVLNLGVSSPTQVSLPNFVPPRNADYNVMSSVTVKEDGVYEIIYVLNASVSTATSLTASVRENGTAIAATENTKSVSPAINATFYGNTIYTLKENSVIDLAISSSNATTVTLNNNASLMLKKIHA